MTATVVGAAEALRHPGPALPRSCTTVRRGRPLWNSHHPSAAKRGQWAHHSRWWILNYDVVKWALFDAPMTLTDTGKPDTTARFVLTVLAEAAHKDGSGAYPSIDRICLATGFAAGTVTDALQRLEDCGVIADDGVVSGHTQWKLAISMHRPPSDKKDVAALNAERRRAESRKRQERRRVKAAKDALSGTQNPGHEGSMSGGLNPGHDGDLSGGLTPGRPPLRTPDIRGFDPRTADLHCLIGTTLGTALESGSAIARPQTPRELDPGSASVGGFSTALLDLETCDPCAHERAHTQAPTHTHEATNWSMWGAPALLNELGRRWDIELDEPSLANAACIRAISRALDAKGVTRDVQDAVTKPPADVQDLAGSESTTDRLRPLKKRDLRIVRDAG